MSQNRETDVSQRSKGKDLGIKGISVEMQHKLKVNKSISLTTKSIERNQKQPKKRAKRIRVKPENKEGKKIEVRTSKSK